MATMQISKVLSIAACGYNECWLQDVIYEDPTILGLGDLQAVMKERTQSQGGRLDLLLKNPDDDSMYEVELQLGATDESHIVRTIEYWDNEKRRWPNRSHTAVLVAEKINSRFFNVVHLLSKAIPIIGIQANIVQLGETVGLHFAKVIDTYEEPDDREPNGEVFGEKDWAEQYPGAFECARWYMDLLKQSYSEISTRYSASYITFAVGGVPRVWFSKRKEGRARIDIKYVEADISAAIDYLNQEGVSFTTQGDKYLSFKVDLRQLMEKHVVHEWLVRRLAPQSLIKQPI